MPLTAAQLAAGANLQLETYAKGDPVDSINPRRPFMAWLLKNKKASVFSNGVFNEKVRISNNGNYQNYTGDDQVTYNRRDTVRRAPFQHYESHDGFSLNETELANNGIILTDDQSATPTAQEETQVVNLLRENYQVMKQSMEEGWDQEVHLDGTQNSKAVPGLDALVSTTPSVGTIGGLDAATYTFWRNNADLAISTATAGNLVDHMETQWRACTTYGKRVPDFIVCGSAYYDAYRKDANSVVSRYIEGSGNQRGGVSIDPSTGDLYFKKVLVVWDPTFDALDVANPGLTYPWIKRCYFLSSSAFFLRPFKGRWMIQRKPPRMYDRYTYYWGKTADYGITMPARNCHSVLSIA
ncbi:MAG TPA: phage major capsid protein [Gammaproteobacteria bacterium]|nr:phage major capsid protein [Gammaproteobacteria bacterium]